MIKLKSRRSGIDSFKKQSIAMSKCSDKRDSKKEKRSGSPEQKTKKATHIQTKKSYDFTETIDRRNKYHYESSQEDNSLHKERIEAFEKKQKDQGYRKLLEVTDIDSCEQSASFFWPLKILDQNTGANIIKYDLKQAKKQVKILETTKIEENPKSQETFMKKESDIDVKAFTNDISTEIDDEYWTSFSGVERGLIGEYKKHIKKLGHCKTTETAFEKLHFLVVDHPKVTKKIVFSLIFGIPLVTPEYILASSLTGKWLEPTDYESENFTKMKDRPDYSGFFGDLKMFVMPVKYGDDFNDYWLIYLLLECNCDVVDRPEEADVVISNKQDKQFCTVKVQGAKVHFDWLINCIIAGKLIDNSSYLFFT